MRRRILLIFTLGSLTLSAFLAITTYGLVRSNLLEQRYSASRQAAYSHAQVVLRDLRSELDSVPGVGPRRRRALLVAFGSLAGVRRASREELTAVVGAKTADAVLGYFAGRGR